MINERGQAGLAMSSNKSYSVQLLCDFLWSDSGSGVHRCEYKKKGGGSKWCFHFILTKVFDVVFIYSSFFILNCLCVLVYLLCICFSFVVTRYVIITSYTRCLYFAERYIHLFLHLLLHESDLLLIIRQVYRMEENENKEMKIKEHKKKTKRQKEISK